MVGYAEDGSVRPNANITRAEVATIFFRLLTDEARDTMWSTTNTFTDVPADAWYNTAVSTMAAGGILQGDETGAFRPNANITRAEFAAIASRFMADTDDLATGRVRRLTPRPRRAGSTVMRTARSARMPTSPAPRP